MRTWCGSEHRESGKSHIFACGEGGARTKGQGLHIDSNIIWRGGGGVGIVPGGHAEVEVEVEVVVFFVGEDGVVVWGVWLGWVGASVRAGVRYTYR